jgi:hypothetical protein
VSVSRVLAVLLGAAAVCVAALAVMLDTGSSESTDDDAAPPGFEGSTPGDGYKPLIFDIGPLVFNPELRDKTLAEARGLGADAIRVVIPWNMVAPEHPEQGFDAANPQSSGYNWLTYDPLIEQIHKLGMRVLLTVGGPAPRWATPTANPAFMPDPGAFGKFVQALATRYHGGFDPDGPEGARKPIPGVDLWSVWNEPNLSIFLQPQYKNGEPYSPLMYRKLYLAAQRAIEANDPGAPILIGETAPTGSTDSVDPIPFLRNTLCLDDNYHELPDCPEADEEIDAAGWAAHPYSLSGQAPFEPVTNPGYVTMSSLGMVERALDSAADEGAIGSDLPLYITEFGVQSEPDPAAGVTLQKQAEFIAIADRIAYGDSRMATFGQYLMRDDSPDVVPGTPYGGFESGLRFFDGRRKPSYEAFRLPLAVQRLGEQVAIWGIVQPYKGPTTVEIHYQDPGSEPKLLRRVVTDEAGTYSFSSGYSDERRWQVVWKAPTDGNTYRSPWYRSYQFAQPASASGG